MARQINEEMLKCGACNKNVKKAKKYYRNGRYYCNKNCWDKLQLKRKAAETKAST